MPVFSRESTAKLETCDPRLQRVMHEVIKVIDIKIIEGYRSPARQRELYEQGRTKPGKIVTQIDGTRVKGKHNHDPARAVDIAPWPIDWEDVNRFIYVAGHVMMAAAMLGIGLRWGGDWNRDQRELPDWDPGHFELI